MTEISQHIVSNIEALHKELGVTGFGFTRNLSSGATIEDGAEHALQMLTSYREYLQGGSKDTERIKLVARTVC